MYATVNAFNAGELSEKMSGRVDVAQYYKGCRTLQNFLVTPYGAVERRPGTKFIARAKYDGKAVRLIPFKFSADISYVLEFGDCYIRAYRDDAFVCELESPYGENDLSEIKYVQSADVMFLAHGKYMVRELKRTSATVFELNELEIKFPALLDPNITETTITPSAATGEITLTASADIFEAGHVGSLWELVHLRTGGTVHRLFGADGTSAELEVYGYWNFSTHGTWSGIVKLQRSEDGENWVDYRTFSSMFDANAETSGEEETEGVFYRATLTGYVAADPEQYENAFCGIVLANTDNLVSGIVQIDSVTDGQNASGTVIKKMGATTATKEWSEAAWSIKRGFPRTVSFFEERLMFGGTDYQPQTIWGSKTNSWNEFETGDKEDDGLNFTLASDTINTIHWMLQGDALMIGTVDAEWTLSGALGEALSPSTPYARRQSAFGSRAIAAKMAGDIVVFAQRRGRKVRGFIYTQDKQGYVSPDLTLMSEHITESGVIDIQIQQQPDTIVWCLLENGTAAALTYERDQEVIGWHRIATDGAIKSVCILPNNFEDVIYLTVERGGKSCLERLAAREYDTISDAVYCDSCVTVTGENLMSVSGLDHLEGKTVQVFADGAVQLDKTVTNGTVTLETKVNKVTCGLGYESILSPMPIEIEMQNGKSVLRRKVISEVRVKVYKSIGGELRAGDDVFQEMISRDVLEDSLDSAIHEKTETLQFHTASGYKESAIVEVRQIKPLPLNISMMTMIYNVAE